MINYYELRRKSEEHAGTAAELTSQAEARKKTLRHCTIAGIIFAILGMSSGTPNEPGPVLAILGFLTPYGFAPMWHWVQEHGFFIVFNWILLLIAAVLAFFTSIVIAPIYIVRSIRLIKANSSLAKQEQSIADRYAAEAIG
ncbi:MAG: hypothetical protein PUE02_04135 [Eggerthellaceae bacterium]|nr:hypothetical protein [Eggerthellaceae bacterium]